MGGCFNVPRQALKWRLGRARAWNGRVAAGDHDGDEDAQGSGIVRKESKVCSTRCRRGAPKSREGMTNRHKERRARREERIKRDTSGWVRRIHKREQGSAGFQGPGKRKSGGLGRNPQNYLSDVVGLLASAAVTVLA